MTYLEKFGRAQTHMQELDARLTEWINTPPYRLIGDSQTKGADGFTTQITRLEINALVPPELPLIIGDTLYNFRSCLDHLAYALARTNLGVAPRGEKVMFPIHGAIGSYMVSGVDAVRGMSPAVQGIIERMQPYHRKNGSETHPLAILNKLSNIDKHRHLAFGFGINEKSSITPNPKARDVIVEVDGGGIRHGPIENKAEVFRVRYRETGPNPHVEVDTDFFLDIAFPQDGPAGGQGVIITLAAIYEHIRTEVIPTLEKHVW